MKQLEFNIEIAAPKQKVWDTLWSDDTYRQWAAAFAEGSHAVAPNWNEGTRVHFLGATGDGMYSDIIKSQEPDAIIFRHLGELKDGKEAPFADPLQDWNGAHEEYYLSEAAGKTHLNVRLQSVDSFADYFNETFPLGLAKLKELSEAQ